MHRRTITRYPRRPAAEQGFTLVEMLVTLAVFGVLITLTASEVTSVGAQEVHSTDSMTALDEAEVLLEPLTSAIRVTAETSGPAPAPAIYLACPYELVFEANIGPAMPSTPSLLDAFIAPVPGPASGAAMYEMYLDEIAQPAGGTGTSSCSTAPGSTPVGSVERMLMQVGGVLVQPGAPLFAYYTQGASQPMAGSSPTGGLSASQAAAVESVQVDATLRYGATSVTGALGTATSLDVRVHLENVDIALQQQANPGSNCYLQAVESSAPSAYWPMDEQAGPEIPDESGSTPPDTGTISGDATPGILPGPVPCDPQGSGTGFAGGTYATTSRDVALPPELSVEAWFETSSGGGLVGFGSASTGSSPQVGPNLWVGAGGHLHFGMATANGGVASISSTGAAGTVATGQWRYAVATVSAGTISLYLDGALVSSAPSAPPTLTEGYWRMAQLASTDLTGSLDSLDGVLADVAVYPYVLSAAQIAAHYEAAGDVPGAPPPPGQDCLSAEVLASRPLAFWRLDDPAGSTTATDLSGNDYTGRLLGGVSSGDPATPYMPTCNPAVTVDAFDGSTGEITTPVGTSQVPIFENGQSGFSIEAWFSLAGVPAGDPRVVADAKTNSTQASLGANEGFELVIDGKSGNGGRDLVTNGYVDMGNGSAGALAPWVKVIQPGTWHLYAATYDGSSVRAYLDGQLLARASLAGPLAEPTWPVTIGTDPATGTSAGDHFDGEIADVAVYRYALSSSQVLAQYEAGVGGGS